jgi:hypothetical protein
LNEGESFEAYCEHALAGRDARAPGFVLTRLLSG